MAPNCLPESRENFRDMWSIEYIAAITFLRAHKHSSPRTLSGTYNKQALV